MEKKVYKRSEVDTKDTWNINLLFDSEASYEASLEEIKKLASDFIAKYKDKELEPKVLSNALDDMDKFDRLVARTAPYASLQSSVDSTDEKNQMRSGAFGILMQQLSESLSFFNNTVSRLSDDVLLETAKLNPKYALRMNDIIKDKKHLLSKEVNDALLALSPTLNSAYQTYNRFKLADMAFPNFKVENQEYPNSFTLFENMYEYEPNTQTRRQAYKAFYDKLSEYQQGLAANYISHLQKERSMARLKGFNSTIEYLLYNQDVTRDMMDRQIDVIMEKLAPAMRRYAQTLKEIHKLDKMTYADLKIAVDHEFEPKVSIEDAKGYVKEGLSILGTDYMKIVNEACDNRWIDFPQNTGKSTGGFCSSPYGTNSFILLNWNGQMDEAMVLAHELGHAGHFQFANKYQNIYDARPSMYFIEAPSTANELIMNRHLLNKATDNRMRRWILSVMISRTYYHNFVTHLLEAAFQRDVYEYLDSNKPLSARVLNQMKLDVIKKFWGDSVEIDDYAGLTWMRQPHYFMGLYPYTYSAGLTIGTVVSKHIFEGTLNPDVWIDVLKAGGTKNPFELSKMAGIDISTDKPLKETIDFISESIDEIISLTQKLKD